MIRAWMEELATTRPSQESKYAGVHRDMMDCIVKMVRDNSVWQNLPPPTKKKQKTKLFMSAG